MRKNLGRILLVMVAISLLGTGCLVGTPSGTAAAGTKYDATQDARIVAIEGIVLGPNGLQALVGALSSKINGIADTSGLSSRISSAESRLSTVEGKVGGTTGGVSQATVDALSARIKTLEDWKATGGSISGGGTADPVDGAILDADGDLQLILERSVEEEVWIDDNVNQTFRLTVKNNGTSSTYFRINADFDCEESVAITSATLTPDYSGSGVATPAAIGASTITSIPFLITSTGSSNKIYIGKSREESMFVTLKVDYASAVGKRWTWDFSIRDVE
jgi:hypothetical protein